MPSSTGERMATKHRARTVPASLGSGASEGNCTSRGGPTTSASSCLRRRFGGCAHRPILVSHLPSPIPLLPSVPHSWQLGQYLDHHPYPKDKPDISEDLVGVIDANLGAFDFKLLNEVGVAVCRLTPQETDVFATAKMRAYAQRRKSDWEAVHVGDGATRKPTPQQMAAHIAAMKKRQAEFETTLKEATEKKRQAYRRLAADDGNPVRSPPCVSVSLPWRVWLCVCACPCRCRGVVVWWCGGVVVWWCGGGVVQRAMSELCHERAR